MLTREILDNLGFTSYKSGPFNDPADEYWQKCYRDSEGNKMFFLDVKHYTIIHPITHADLGGYEINTQLYRRGSHDAIDIKFHDDNIDNALEIINTLFDMGLVENYENRR